MDAASLKVLFTGDTKGLDSAFARARKNLTSFQSQAARAKEVSITGDTSGLQSALGSSQKQLASFRGKADQYTDVNITGDTSGLQSALGGASKSLSGFSGEADSAVRTTGYLNTHLGSLGGAALGARVAVGSLAGAAGLGGLAVAFGAAAATGISFNNQLEQADIAFTTMLGSGQKAQAFLNDLKAFAASTPFEFPDLVEASQKMMAMGFAAKDVKPLLTDVGNAAAAMGSGASGVDAITRALGQMKATTTVQLGEINQLTEQGIPALQLLADEMGVSAAQAREAIEQNKVSADTFIKAFQEYAEKNYGGMMAKQAQTAAGAWSTLKDNVRNGLATAFEPTYETLTQILLKAGEFAGSKEFQGWLSSAANLSSDLLEQVKKLGPQIQDAWNEIFDVPVGGAEAGSAAARKTLNAEKLGLTPPSGPDSISPWEELGKKLGEALKSGITWAINSLNGEKLVPSDLAYGVGRDIAGPFARGFIAGLKTEFGGGIDWGSMFKVSFNPSQLLGTLKNALVGRGGLADIGKAVVMGIGAAIKNAWSGAGGVKQIVGAIWNGIKAAFRNLIGGSGGLMDIGRVIVAPFQWAYDKLLGHSIIPDIVNGIRNWFNRLKGMIAGPLNAVRNAIIGAWNKVKQSTTQVWNAIKGAVSQAWNQIKQSVSQALNQVRQGITNAWNQVKQATSSAWTAVKTAVTSRITEAKNVATSTVNALKSALSNTWNQIKSTASSVWQAIGSTITDASAATKAKVEETWNSMLEFVAGVLDKLGFHDQASNVRGGKAPMTAGEGGRGGPQGLAARGGMIDGSGRSEGIQFANQGFAKGGGLSKPRQPKHIIWGEGPADEAAIFITKDRKHRRDNEKYASVAAKMLGGTFIPEKQSKKMGYKSGVGEGLGPTTYAVYPEVRAHAEEIMSGTGATSWNTYIGHGEPGGSDEQSTIDIWGAGGRGAPIAPADGFKAAEIALGQTGPPPPLHHPSGRVLARWGVAAVADRPALRPYAHLLCAAWR